MCGARLYTVASTYLAASPYSRSSSSPTTTATARPPRIVSFSIYVAVNVLDLFTQFSSAQRHYMLCYTLYEVYNRVLKSYNKIVCNDFIQWFQTFMLKIQYDFEFKIQLWKIINPQSTIFGKSNFHWTYVIKYCRKLNAKMIAVFFHCVVRADTRGNVNREQNKWHRAPVRLERGRTSFPIAAR